jgi:predicted RNA-binding protein associated with RNAse of E/G family
LLEVKEKNLDRREWYNDTQRDFKCMYQKDEYFEGGVGLITFTGLTEPEMVDSPNGQLCIADNGYQWLELAPKGGNYVITSMFREGKIFQHYVDITLRNDIAENGDAKFYDLFLDVVVSEDGKAQTIDQNELEEAYNDGVINKEELELARKAAGDVLKLLDKNKEMLEQKIIEYRRILSESL